MNQGEEKENVANDFEVIHECTKEITLSKAFIELLKVKSLLSLSLIATTCYLAVSGKIEPATFIAITSAVVTYYFTKKEKNDIE